MAGEDHGAEAQEVSQTPQGGDQQEMQEQVVGGVDWQSAIRERDSRIAEIEAQVAEGAKSAEAAEALRGEIAELKAQREDQRVEFELRLAGVRNVKAARAALEGHGGDVAALREAEPWLFADTPNKPQNGKTGLPNAGTSADDGKTMRRWRRIAGLEETDEE